MGERPIGVTDEASGAGVADYRTRERSVGGSTQVEQYVVPERELVAVGSYRAPFAIGVSSLTAQTANTQGWWWLLNQSANVVVVVHHVLAETLQAGANTARIAATRQTLWRMTATGTPTGSQVIPSRVRQSSQNGITADAAPVATLRTAITGLTVTEGEAFHTFLMRSQLTNTGPDGWHSYPQTFAPLSRDGAIFLANGEGIVCRQIDAGASNEGNRHMRYEVAWDEVTLP